MPNNLTDQQMAMAIAALANNVTVPMPNGQANGMYVNGANQLFIPFSVYNQAIGNNLNANTDASQNIYISLGVGAPAGGS